MAAWYDIPEGPLEPREEGIRPVCPVCGNECDTFHRDFFRRIVGCENCMTDEDAWEAPETLDRMKGRRLA